MTGFDAAQVVGTGGAIGALFRHYVSRRVPSEEYPMGTFAVNVLGSFVLGLLTFSGVAGDLSLLLGTGACGAFTTFSSFAYETVRFAEADEYVKATVYSLGTLASAGGAVLLAWLVAQAF